MALLAGYGENSWVHGVGDGASWLAGQMAEVFPRQRFLLDRYHLLEHLYAGATGLATASGFCPREWVAQQLAQIDAAKVAQVIAECRALAGEEPEHPLAALGRYLEHQREHLDYGVAREQGLPVGSGAVEGGHRHVIQARLKLPGTWWKEATVNSMLVGQMSCT